MLEIKNLTKVYKTKNGAETVALAGVSLKFGERGMVFLLGKSGSGKSTLLNLCGGLDSPDSGEVIIKGRSSRDFSQSDFDSYRNTFVGFVFQEYNILNEFTVEENIALALELQGKSKNSERVREILEQVELQDFAKRKPNTLSGGQKQRVAIARALVKNPEIIMADEPTGALDSETGRQVFETLKKLSADKLVIVVSHDREFAALYGDRIIELKDGKVISDVTKTVTAAEDDGKNLREIGEDTLTLKSGAALSAEDIQRINAFLASAEDDVVILKGKQNVDEYKKAAHIADTGGRETFENTDALPAPQREYSPEESRFIRSSLPIRHAVKIGASSMKVKPFRLFFTILLSVISFTLFGLFSTMTFYDPAQTAAQNYMETGLSQARVRKMYTYDNVYYSYDGTETQRYEDRRYTAFTPAELDGMRELYGDETLGFINFADEDSGGATALYIYNAGEPNSTYYSTRLSAFATFVPEAWQNKMLTDTDLSTLGDDEIVISSYTFDSLRNAGLYEADGKEMIALRNYDDILGVQLEIYTSGSGNKKLLTVAGVYKNDLPERFDEFKGDGGAGADSDELLREMRNEISYGAYDAALVSDGFYAANAPDYVEGTTLYGFAELYEHCNALCEAELSDGSHPNYLFGHINSLSADDEKQTPPIAYFDGRSGNSLEDDEIVINIASLSADISNILQQYIDELYAQASEIIDEEPDEAERLYAIANEAYTQMQNAVQILAEGMYKMNEYDDEGNIVSGEYVDATEEQFEAAAQTVLDFVNDRFNETGKSCFKHTISYNNAQYGMFEVAGFYYGKTALNLRGVYFSPSGYEGIVDNHINLVLGFKEETNYVRPADAIYDYIYIALPNDYGALYDLSRGENGMAADSSYIVLDTALAGTLDNVNYYIEMLGEIFLWIGVVMAVFAMLLLFNFISVSITYKKKEIGILRAVGARSADVFKIFYSESVIITVICYILAMIASFAICIVLNARLIPDLGVTIFVFGPLSWLVMAGIAVTTSLIATFLPVYTIAKRKPVESIRAL